MNPYLEWTLPGQPYEQIEIVDKVFIGRTCKGIDPAKRIVLNLPSLSRNHAVIGDSTNVAFRLSGLANKVFANKILLCEQTANLVRDSMPLEDLGLTDVRGRSGQEHIYGLIVDEESRRCSEGPVASEPQQDFN